MKIKSFKIMSVLLLSIFIMGASQCTQKTPDIDRTPIDESTVNASTEETMGEPEVANNGPVDYINDMLCQGVCSYGPSFLKRTTMNCVSDGRPGQYVITEQCARIQVPHNFIPCRCVNTAAQPTCIYLSSTDCRPIGTSGGDDEESDETSDFNL